MKLLPLLTLFVLVGCSSEAQNSAQRSDPNVGLSPQEKIEKIQNDPNMPDGLKKIQTETLQHQAGIR